MSQLKAGKITSGISVTPSHNFELDASAADGTLVLKRASGEQLLTISAAGVVSINGSGDPYGKSNILGTVSQSGGIPTGAIVERGSNANGGYVKFADGTLICTNIQSVGSTVETADGSVFRSSAATWTYPMSFVAIPSLSREVYGGLGSTWAGMGVDAAGTTSASFMVWRAVSFASTPLVTLLAIGRWF